MHTHTASRYIINVFYVFCAVSSAFIVYAKEQNDPHGVRVLCLSNLLNNCGIECDIDLYHSNENIVDWSFWVGKNLEYHIASQHSYIIMVCSPTIISTLEERNDNARIEMVAAYIDRLTLRYHLEEGAQKIFPVFINDPSANCVPPSLSGKTCYHFPYDKLLYELPECATAEQVLGHPDFASLRSLVASLTGQQEIPAPGPNVAQGKYNLNSSNCVTRFAIIYPLVVQSVFTTT